MKILIDLTSLADNLSGIERYALNISKEIIKQDNKNKYILVFKNEVHREFEKFKNKENISFKILYHSNKLIFNQIILTRYLYKTKVDKYLFLAFPSPILFRKRGIINTIHDLTAWDYPKTMKTSSRIYFKFSIKNAFKVSEKILTVSEFSKNRIKDMFKFGDVNVIYNGVSDVFIKNNLTDNRVEEIDKKYKLPKDYIMCLCTLEPRKNIELLIRAYIDLKIQGKINDKLVLVGRNGWKIENLLKEISEKYSEDIIITGFVNDLELPYIYKHSKCFVFPSLYEGFGIPVLEAMYMGVPVICSNTSSLPEVIKGSGITFENNNLNDLKEKIELFLCKSDEDKLYLKNRAMIRSLDFKWSKESSKLIEILQQ